MHQLKLNNLITLNFLLLLIKLAHFFIILALILLEKFIKLGKILSIIIIAVVIIKLLFPFAKAIMKVLYIIMKV